MSRTHLSLRTHLVHIAAGAMTFLFAIALVPPSHTIHAEEPDGFSMELFNKHVEGLSQPSSPLKFPLVDDRIHRRGKPVVIGHLEFLGAFATVKYAKYPVGERQKLKLDKLHIPRDEINFILLDGSGFPDEPPMLSVEEDSVLLDSGKVLTGFVTVKDKTVHIAGQKIPANEVALIHLADPNLRHRPIAEATPIEDRDGNDAEPENDANATNDSEGEHNNPRNARNQHTCWVGTVTYRYRSIEKSIYNNVRWQPEEDVEDSTVTYRVMIRERPPFSAPHPNDPTAHLYLEHIKIRGRATVTPRLVKSRRDGDITIYERTTPPRFNFSAHGSEFVKANTTIAYTTDKEWGLPLVGYIYSDEDDRYWLNLPDLGLDIKYLTSHVAFPYEKSYTEKSSNGVIRKNTPIKWSIGVTGSPGIGSGRPGPGKAVSVDPHERWLQDDGNMMAGSFRKTNQPFSHVKYEYEASWYLQRVKVCPLAKGDPPNTENNDDPCFYERLQLEEAEEFVKRHSPMLERIENELGASAQELDQLVAQMKALEPSFREAMALAGVSHLTKEVLEIILTRRLAKLAPTATQGVRIRHFMSLMSLLRDPKKWVLTNAHKGEGNAYEIYQNFKLLSAMIEDRYEPQLEYIDKHLNTVLGDNAIGMKAKKFVKTARQIAPLMRKVSLLMEEGTQYHSEIQEAKLEAEFWRKELEKCEKKHAVESN